MSGATRGYNGRFNNRLPDPIVAGSSLDAAQSIGDGQVVPRRTEREPKQLLVRLDGAQHERVAWLMAVFLCMNLDHPELIVSWGSEFPDKLKLRKQVTLWPLRFKLRADYNRTARSFAYGCSCKDAILGGRFRADANSHEIEYRKRLRLGNGQVGATVKGSYAGIWDSTAPVKPQVSFEYELWGGAAIWAGNAINWRHKLRAPRLSRSLALEVAGNVELPAPAARYEWQRNNIQRLSVGQGAFKLHFDQCNVLLNL